MSIRHDHFDKEELNHISSIAYAFRQSRALFSGFDLKLFTILGDEKKTVEQLSKEVGVDERALTRLLNALVSIDLLEKQMQTYSNTSATRKYLSEDSGEYAGHILSVADQWELWSNLTDTIKKGFPSKYEEFEEKEEDWMSNWAASMHYKATTEADEILSTLDLSEVESVLDLGGGTGYYSHRLLQKYPHLKCTVYDHPRLRPYAEEFLKSTGTLDKVRLISGGFFEKEFGHEKEYDLVLISHTLSEFSIWDNVEFLTKVYHFLKLDGKIVINERILDDSRTSPAKDALRSLDLLVKTKKGELFTETDIWVMLREGMFVDIKKIKTSNGKYIMVGSK